MENNFLEVIRNGRFDENYTECDFEAHYDEYIVTGTIDCIAVVDETKDESVGIMSDSFRLEGCSFWHLKTTVNDESEITLNKKEMIDVKQRVENFFDNLIQEF